MQRANPLWGKIYLRQSFCGEYPSHLLPRDGVWPSDRLNDMEMGTWPTRFPILTQPNPQRRHHPQVGKAEHEHLSPGLAALISPGQQSHLLCSVCRGPTSVVFPLPHPSGRCSFLGLDGTPQKREAFNLLTFRFRSWCVCARVDRVVHANLVLWTLLCLCCTCLQCLPTGSAMLPC